MASIGDVAAILRAAVQVIDEARASAQAAEIETGQAVAELRAALEDSSNQLVGEGFAQWEQAKAQIEEALTLYQAGNEAMGNYVAAIAGGAAGGARTAPSPTTARARPTGVAAPASASSGMSIWLPGDEAYESLRNDLGDPLKPPEDVDPSDDSSFSKARQFGRGFIRGADDLKSFGSDLASSTAGVHQGMDLPDPDGYDAATLAPEVPVVQQPPPPPGPAPNDLVGNTILMAAVLTEAGARIFDRFAGTKESRDGDTS